MEKKVPRLFVMAGLIWLCGGTTLGLGMAIRPEWILYRPAHVHMNLVGFVTMIIFGVGYQILPRMLGYGLFSPRLAAGHWAVANVGLALMVLGFAVRPHFGMEGGRLLIAGGVLQTLGAYSFAYNLFRSMRRPRAFRGGSPVRPLPVVAVEER